MRSLRPVILASLVCLGCGETAAPPGSTRPEVDKSRLYGNPGLVPSRDGERARRELALTADLERALGSAPGVDAARVVVRSDRDQVRIFAGLELRPEAEPGLSEEAARRHIELLAPDAEALVESRPSPAEPVRHSALSAGLALVLLCLGSSLGVLFERLRQRRITRA